MSGKGKLVIVAFIAVALLYGFGFLRLFALRFERGDIFPPYSSLRSDPLGCKALFMALERSSGLEARRNFRDPERLTGNRGVTIYWLGGGEALLDATGESQARSLEALARQGNRVVIAFGWGRGKPCDAGKQEAKEDDEGDEKEEGTTEKGTDAAPKGGEKCGVHAPPAGGAGPWGIGTGTFEVPAGGVKTPPRAALSAQVAELPATIPLRTRRHFTVSGTEWRPVYSHNDRPVLLERRVGTGSIVLLADSYLFSNEAMRNDRLPGLMAWLQGANRTALFDESHLGVYEDPGVMTLVKKHRLVPFLATLLVLAALYVWKSAVPFVTAAPPDREYRPGEVRDNFSGLVNLLRRNIPPGELLNACFREWTRSFSRDIKQHPDLDREVRAVLADEKNRPAGKRDPVAAYRKIKGLLSGFRWK